MNDLPNTVDILIIGAGPTGLTLAAELQRQGATALVIDKQAQGANTSRAAVIHARTLEVLEPLTATPELVDQGLKVATFRVRDRDKSLASVSFKNIPSAYPFALMIPQNDTEAILLGRLQALGGQVVRPVEAVAIRPMADSVEVDLARDGETHTVTAKWLIGCDGGRSLARETAKIDFTGGTYAHDFVLTDVHMSWPITREEVTLFFSTLGFVMVAPLPGTNARYRIVASSENVPEHPDVPYMQALLDERGPIENPARIDEIMWASRFRIHHRVTSTPRAGRILLCGDAAHLHSPAGGQGMNTGIQDAVSLAPALLDVLHGGDEAGLDAWAQSRHQVAKRVVGLTDKMTRAAGVTSPVGRQLRNAAISFVSHVPAAREALAREIAELAR